MLLCSSHAAACRPTLRRGEPKLAARSPQMSRSSCACRGTSSSEGQQTTKPSSVSSGQRLQSQLLRSAGAAVLSTALLLSPVQLADAQDAAVVPQQPELQAPAPPQASSYTSLAKPLPKQPVNKGRVWAVLVGGAVVLFTGTLLLENYEAFFPAIAKANKAMAVSRKKDQQNQRQQDAVDAQEAQAEVIQQQQQQQQVMSSTPQAASTSASSRDVDAVQAGMEEARQRILAQQQQQQQQQQGAPSSSTFPAQLDAGAQAPSGSGSSSSAGSSRDKDDDSSSGSGGGGGASAPASTGTAQEAPAAESASSEHAGSGNSSSAGVGAGSVGSSSGSVSGSSRPLTNEEINAAARSMRMQTGSPGASPAEAQSGGAAALQPANPSQGSDSAAAAAATAAMAVGSSASRSARLSQFVGGVMQEGGQAGFLSAMRGKGRS